MLHKITSAFPWIVTLSALLGLVHPPIFTWFQGSLLTLGLGGIMLGMGLTLKGTDFVKVIRHPKWVFLGLGLQFILMPLLGWSLAQLFQLPPLSAVGMVLVASCPGGTASNVIAYLAKGEIALSVCMTSCSTLAAIVITPFLTLQLSGSTLDIPAIGLFYSTLKVVLIPIVIGVFVNRYSPKIASKILPYAPPTAVILICLIVASIVGQGKEIILSSGLLLIFALLGLHLLGFILGFVISLITFKNWKVAKTISIEVGMQNSGLGTALAAKHFPLMSMTPAPCALSAIVHCVVGSLLASKWAKENGEKKL